MVLYSHPIALFDLYNKNDPIVEYKDEFGRMRTTRRSEIPRHLAPSTSNVEPDDIECVLLPPQ